VEREYICVVGHQVGCSLLTELGDGGGDHILDVTNICVTQNIAHLGSQQKAQFSKTAMGYWEG
jgi:hypothetical protein